MKFLENIIRKKTWSSKSHIQLFENLVLYIGVGMPITQALYLCIERDNKARSIDISRLIEHIEQGRSLASGMKAIMNLPETLVHFLEQGEYTGQIPESMKMVKSILEKKRQLLAKIKYALLYPLVIGIFTTVLTIGLVRGVMPQIIPLLEGLNTELPLLTRLVISLSNIISEKGLIIFVGCLIMLIIFTIFKKKYQRFNKNIQKSVYLIPIVGRMQSLYALSIFLRSMGNMLCVGINIAKAYSMTVNGISFLPLKHVLLTKVHNIESGENLSIVMANKFIPSSVIALTRAGEGSGALSTSLIHSADILDHELDHKIKIFTSMIEPIMMIAMGVIVGAIALSIMMPIYDISRVIQAGN